MSLLLQSGKKLIEWNLSLYSLHSIPFHSNPQIFLSKGSNLIFAIFKSPICICCFRISGSVKPLFNFYNPAIQWSSALLKRFVFTFASPAFFFKSFIMLIILLPSLYLNKTFSNASCLWILSILSSSISSFPSNLSQCRKIGGSWQQWSIQLYYILLFLQILKIIFPSRRGVFLSLILFRN